jgi:hypothetical protein
VTWHTAPASGDFHSAQGYADLKRIDPTPRRTVESIKEDIQMAREVRQ